MGRKVKYTEEHLKKVEWFLNQGLNKVDSILKAGFSDTSLYYLALKRYDWIEQLTIKKKGTIDKNNMSFL